MTGIVLTGFMGSGKSTVGRMLAVRLGRPFLDADRLFEQRFGAIESFFAEHGEGLFRKKESEILRAQDWKQPLVLATGGGVIKDWRNMIYLRCRGRIVLLDPGFEAIAARLKEDSTRPLWQVGAAARLKLYRERLPLYRRYADLIVTEVDTARAVERILQHGHH